MYSCGESSGDKQTFQGEWQLRMTGSVLGIAEISQNQTIYFMPDGNLVMAEFNNDERIDLETGNWQLEDDILSLTIQDYRDSETISGKIRELENGDYEMIGLGEASKANMTLIPIRTPLEIPDPKTPESLGDLFAAAVGDRDIWEIYHLLFPLYDDGEDQRLDWLDELVRYNHRPEEIQDEFNRGEFFDLPDDIFEEFKEDIAREIEREAISPDDPVAKLEKEDLMARGENPDNIDLVVAKHEGRWLIFPVN